MAFYSGQASSYSELLNVLTSKSVENGWSFSDGILFKNESYIRPFVSNKLEQDLGPGLVIEAGTGKSGSNLLNRCDAKIRIGKVAAITKVPEPTFPCDYFLFIFETETYLIIKYEINRFMFLSFGFSENGTWCSGTISAGYSPIDYSDTYEVSFGMNEEGQTNYVSVNYQLCALAGFHWQNGFNQHYNVSRCTTSFYYSKQHARWILSGTYGSPFTRLGAIAGATPLIARQLSAWSSNSCLLPVQLSFIGESNKSILACEIQHARYFRVDNYEPLEIVTYGSDKWMVFPFHKKNTSQRVGATTTKVDHTGTLGWAIRYEGA